MGWKQPFIFRLKVESLGGRTGVDFVRGKPITRCFRKMGPNKDLQGKKQLKLRSVGNFDLNIIMDV